MRHIINLLLLTYRHIHIISLHSLINHTQDSLTQQAFLVSREIHFHLASMSNTLTHLSFISHSIGSLVLRLALNSPLLNPFRSKFNLFLSLNAPHLGVLFPTLTLDWGSKFYSFFNNSKVVQQLLLKEEKNQRNSLLYKMALNSGLEAFRYLYLFSSCQDTFVPFHSERVETNPTILGTKGIEKEVYQEMVNGFWNGIIRAEKKVKVKKFDVYYEVRESMYFEL